MSAPLASGLHQEPYHYYGGYTPFWYEHFLKQAGFVNPCIIANGHFFKFYGQESIRFAKLCCPLYKHKRWSLRLIALPFWILVVVPWFVVLAPLVCYWLDPFDTDKQFTIGYHVSAVKGPVDP
jgi:hypothetical protein